MGFIKKVFHGDDDKEVHAQFVRFGKGEYGRRALISLRKTKSVKIKGSFEFANDFVLFLANLPDAGEIKFHGDIWSRDELGLEDGKKKTGKWVYSVKEMGSSQVKSLADKVYYFLLSAEGGGIKLKIKGKLPKPGKDESRIDDKFCQMELPEKFYAAAKNEFFWDMPDAKKISIEHKYIINEIVMPGGLGDDFAKIREAAKRKGKIIRIANADGKEMKEEKNFEA